MPELPSNPALNASGLAGEGQHFLRMDDAVRHGGALARGSAQPSCVGLAVSHAVISVSHVGDQPELSGRAEQLECLGQSVVPDCEL